MMANPNQSDYQILEFFSKNMSAFLGKIKPY